MEGDEGLTSSKRTNFSKWYLEVLTKGRLVFQMGDSLLLLPSTSHIWDAMSGFFKSKIKNMGVNPSAMPTFLPKDSLQDDTDVLTGFAPEVPSAINPATEAVYYHMFSKRIKGHTDLPYKVYNWAPVTVSECSNPIPLIRTREFLCLEGHTAFATKEEAETEVQAILELYRQLCEEYLAVPVVTGTKSEMKKFGGGLYTASLETFIPSTGQGVQAAVAHCLGQSFAKQYRIIFQDENGENAMAWQNSWAYTSTMIGAMVMIHGDDRGLVLPPKVSEVQVIVVPVRNKDEDLKEACSAIVNTLCDSGILAKEDNLTQARWEMEGVPLRIEIGTNDLGNNSQVQAVRRDNGETVSIPMSDLVAKVKDLLDNIQQSMFDVAKQKRDACIQVTKTWDEFIEALGQQKLILAPWCDEEVVERDVKAKVTQQKNLSAKTLCSPFQQPKLPEGTLCFASGKPAKKWTYWGQSC